MSTTTQPTACPSWCESDHDDRERLPLLRGTRHHFGGTVTQPTEGPDRVTLGVYAHETPDGTARPLMRLCADDVLLTVDQLLSLSDMCARAAIVLGDIERGESR